MRRVVVYTYRYADVSNISGIYKIELLYDMHLCYFTFTFSPFSTGIL